MEVILKQNVDKVGQAGAVVKVKDGFARNFLIPNKLAIPLTPSNLKRLEEEKHSKAVQSEKEKAEKEELKAKLGALSLTITAQAKEEDKIFGSIGTHEISSALKDEGFDVDRNLILLDEPIKSLGIYEVPIRLHPEVTAKVKLWIVKK